MFFLPLNLSCILREEGTWEKAQALIWSQLLQQELQQGRALGRDLKAQHI